MRFAQDSTSGINVIRAYGNGELNVNEAFIVARLS